jgi:general secretion pathway protein G
MKRNHGFTLIEVIVVAAIIAILAGILVPMIFNQIDEAKKTRALADCKSISTAITMFRKDTQKWPYYDSEDCTFMYHILQTGTGGDPVDAPAPGDWGINNNAVALGFLLNLPGAKPAVAQLCYGGKASSYMTEDKVDPWGNKYIVNAASFGTTGPVWVISAGPNGALDTNSTSQTLNDIGTSGDDIGVRVK